MSDNHKWVAGVDGCRIGWFVVLWDGEEYFEDKVCPTFQDVVQLIPEPAITAVDMPIGLLDQPEEGGRVCDREARRLLGPRRSSVFSPPTRQVLMLNHPVRLSKQVYALLPKMREVDEVMRQNPALQQRVKEVHPELCFYGAGGSQPMSSSKKKPAGKEERIDTLVQKFGESWQRWYQKVQKKYLRKEVAIDDILDASIAVWSALRILNKKAERIPSNPPEDEKGLRMEMWY